MYSAPGDSIALARWNRRDGRIERLAQLRSYTPRTTPSRQLGIPMVMYAPEDAWTVAPDGSLVVVRSGDFSVERRRPDGTLVRGPSHAYHTSPVSSADRTWMVRRFLSTSPMSGRGPDGGMGLTPASLQTDAEVARITAGSEFASALPYFSPGGVWVGPIGRSHIYASTIDDDGLQRLERDRY